MSRAMDGELRWRAAVDADAEALVALIRAAYRGQASRAGWTSEADLVGGDRIDTAGVRALIDPPRSTILVVGDGAAPVACCNVQDRGAAVAYLGTFAVAPQLQAHGVGRALMAAAERFAASRLDARTMEIRVLGAMEALVAWYERLGFAATGDTEPFPADAVQGRPLRDGLRFIVMRKPLV